MPRVHYRVTTKGVRAYQERLLAQMRENDRRSRLLARTARAARARTRARARRCSIATSASASRRPRRRPLPAAAASPPSRRPRSPRAARSGGASPLAGCAARMGGVRAPRAEGALADGWPAAMSCSSSIASRRHTAAGRAAAPCCENVSLEMRRRESSSAIWGTRRSGRSTLLRIAAGLERRTPATVRFAGRKLHGRDSDALRARSATAAARSARSDGRAVLDQLMLSQLARGASSEQAIAAREKRPRARRRAQRCSELRPSELARRRGGARDDRPRARRQPAGCS